MPWSSEFLDALDSGRSDRMFRLDVPVWGTQGVGLAWSVGTHSSQSPLDSGCHIIAQSVSSSSSRVAIGTWTLAQGGFTVQVAGDVAGVLQHMTRGSVVNLSMGFIGWSKSQYQRIAMGVLRNITGTPPLWTLQFDSLLMALRNRITTTRTSLQLFDGVDSSTTVGVGGYTAGALTLTVVDSSGFEADSAAGREGLVRVTPTTGDPFYLAWSGSTATTFTVEATARLGTTAVDAVSGDLVEEIGYVQGTIPDIVRRILVSSGTASTNGTYDTLPSTWGYNIPSTIVDDAGFDAYRDNALVDTAGATYEWDLWTDAPQDNGLSWLTGKLSTAGVWLLQVQGDITLRCAQDPNATTRQVSAGYVIRDKNIVPGSVQWEGWDSSVAVEYGSSQMTTADGSDPLLDSPDVLATLPAGQTKTRDLSTVLFSAGSAVRDGDLSRIGPWDLRIPERLTMQIAGLWMARYAPGDMGTLYTTQAYGRFDVAGTAYNNRRVTITEISPNWAGASVLVTFAVLPSSGTEFA